MNQSRKYTPVFAIVDFHLLVLVYKTQAISMLGAVSMNLGNGCWVM